MVTCHLNVMRNNRTLFFILFVTLIVYNHSSDALTLALQSTSVHYLNVAHYK
jgi:hypothetical protein